MRALPLLLLLTSTAAAADRPVAPPPRLVEQAVIESSLATGDRGARIRQFAFDANPATYFASDKNATKADHLTLTFDGPVSLKFIRVVSGKPNGDEKLAAGVVECLGDDKTPVLTVKFADGIATFTGNMPKVKAVRIRPTEDLKTPLVVREITIDSAPKVEVFRFPIEFTLDVTDAPEMKEWGDKVIRICEREYPRICDILMSDGFTPVTRISMALKNDYKGVAEASGARIKGSVKYFKDRPNDIGAMVHETVHCVQLYRGRVPGWLVEGVADYVRFWKYEPGKAGKVNPDRAQYNGSYRTTAAFLAFVTDKYDPTLVTKLNALMRSGKFDDTAWKTLTGKTAEELNREWRESLTK